MLEHGEIHTDKVDHMNTMELGPHMEAAALRVLDDINVEEWCEDFVDSTPIVVEVKDYLSRIMNEVEEEPYKGWLTRELSGMGMGLEMQPGEEDMR